MGTRRGILDDVDLVVDLPGLHFNAAEIDSLILEHGSSGELRRAMICPCRRIDTRTPVTGCPSCSGTGTIYPEELREPMIFLESQRSATVDLTAAGVIPSGSIQITVPSGVIPGMGDMFLPDGEVHVVNELLWVEGSNRVSDPNLRFQRMSADAVRPALGTRKERLLYPSPCCIERVQYLREGRLLSAAEIEYHVDAEGVWTWRGDAGPEPGNAWSVRYRASAVYVIHKSVPRLRTEGGHAMPYLVTAARLDKLAPVGDLRDA